MANMEDLCKYLLRLNAPLLTGRHTPSTASVSSLQPATFKNLQYQRRHKGKVIYVVVRDTILANGMTLTVEDSNGDRGLVCSLIDCPFPGGEASMSQGTIIAVKEPVYGMSIKSQLAVCVHHPTDIARISKFDHSVATIFPNLADVHSKDFLEAGNAKFADGKMMDAIDCYAEGIKQARIAGDSASDSANFRGLLLKRALAYIRLNLHSAALLGITELLDADGNHQRALKLGCNVCLELGKYETAQRYISTLTTLAPEDKANKKLNKKVATRVKQAEGNFNLGEIAKSVKQPDVVPEISEFIGPIEIRKSELGGRGMFAKCRIGQGQLLLCEKPLALLTEDKQSGSSLTNGLRNVMTGNVGYSSQNSMSLVRLLASKTATDPALFERFLDLYDGESNGASGTAEPEAKVFNRGVIHYAYRALKVIKYNAHVIKCGNASMNYTCEDPQCHDPFIVPVNAKGVWYLTSLFNHSCLPTAGYAWVANLMVVHAHRDIEADEEITLSYVATGQTYEKRQSTLNNYGMHCSCDLCKAESSLPQPLADRRREFQTPFVPAPSSKNPQELETTLRKCLSTYPGDAYKDIPYVGLAKRMLHLGHLYLGPLQSWRNAGEKTGAKAADCFNATLELCLGITLIKDPESPYCELSFSKHCQPDGDGILALVGLAELAVTSGNVTEWARSGRLISFAKLLYKLRYGEDWTFDNHHSTYLFRHEEISPFIPPEEVEPPENWDEIKASATAKPRQIPSFLR